MKATLTKSNFIDSFYSMGRQNHFSYDGLGALYDLLEELNPNYELDVIGLCCEFLEDEAQNILKNYGLDSIEELKDNTLVIEIPDTYRIIIQAY